MATPEEIETVKTALREYRSFLFREQIGGAMATPEEIETVKTALREYRSFREQEQKQQKQRENERLGNALRALAGLVQLCGETAAKCESGPEAAKVIYSSRRIQEAAGACAALMVKRA